MSDILSSIYGIGYVGAQPAPLTPSRRPPVKNFITASETNRRLSEEHRELRDNAVEEINKVIRLAKSFPVGVPKSLLTDVTVVKCELLRKLKEEGGWDVDLGIGAAADPTAFVYLYLPFARLEEVKEAKK